MIRYKQFRLRGRAENLHAHILFRISNAHACHLPSASYVYINDKTMQHKLRGTT